MKIKTSTGILILIISVIASFCLYLFDAIPLNWFLFCILVPVIGMLTVEMLYTKKEEDSISAENEANIDDY